MTIDDTTRRTLIQRLNINGTETDNTTVAGQFKVRVHFLPSATGLAQEELEITNGAIVNFLEQPRNGTNVWYVDILPDQGAISVTVRVPPDVVDGGNQPAEVTYDAVEPLTVELTTTATEPVIGEFQVTATFSSPVTDNAGGGEGDVEWVFLPGDDLEITRGTYVGYQSDFPSITGKVWNITIRPNANPGTLTGVTPKREGSDGPVHGGLEQRSQPGSPGRQAVRGLRAGRLHGCRRRHRGHQGDPGRRPLNTVVIPISVMPQGGAASPEDYSGIPPSVTFNSGETEKTFTFSAAQDDRDDDGESVKIAFGTPLPNIIKRGSTPETTVSITDDDTAGVTINPVAVTVSEGGTATYTVVLSSQPAGDVTVTVNDPTDNTDVTAGPASLTFTTADWNVAQTVTVSAAQDGDAADETATISHTADSTADPAYQGISTDDVAVTLEDDAPNSLTVNFKETGYTAAEGGTVDVTVTLDLDPERTITVPLNHIGQGGADGNDYSGVPPSVTFDSGDTEKTFAFSAEADSIDDDGESVKLTFGTLPTGVSEGPTGETVVSITDDDVPSVNVSYELGTYTVAEGNSITVKVKLSADPERTVEIPITSTGQGGATSADYSGLPEDLTFNAGETEKTFTFSAEADNINDDGESVKLTFGSPLPNRVSEGTTNEAVVSITDDDVPQVQVSFEESTYTVAEGSSETVKVELSADPERAVTILITKTNQGGASNSDYSAPASVTFNSGETEKTFTFSATDDSDNDDGESVRLGFGSTLPTGISAGTINESVVSITDDDLPSVEVSFEQATYTVAEGNSETIKVKLDVDPERTVTIPITKTNQGGASNSDYSAPANVTFNSGETEETFTFTAASDSIDDDGESVKLDFGTPLPDGVTVGAINESVVSITDDDAAGVSISESSLTITEGSTGTYTVALDSQPLGDVTVTTLGAGTDLSLDNTTLTFTTTTWASAQTVTVTAVDDEIDDDGETVTLTHTVASADDSGYQGISAGSVVVSITDNDDPAVTVSFQQSTYTVAEGSSETVKVNLSADPERTVTIDITKALQGGASSADYSGVPENLTFNRGETEATFTFTAASDNIDDDGESVKLGFGTPLPDGVTVGTINESIVSITDDDLPQVDVSFENATYTVAEGNSETIKVKLDKDPERTVTILITKGGQDGATSSDYSAPASVTFNSGETEKTFTFSATDDDIDDDGESVKLTFGAMPTGVSEGPTSETVVSITDDDAAGVSVSESSLTIAEGSTDTYTVVLNSQPLGDVTVTIAGAGADLSTDNTALTFTTTTWASAQTVTVTAVDDEIDDDGETVTLTHTVASDDDSGYQGISAGSVVVSITDNDDPAVTVSFEQATYTVAEGSSETVKVNLSTDPERTVTILITKAGQDGATSSDYLGVPASVTFNSGETGEYLHLHRDP